MKDKEKSEKDGLKLNILKTKIIASGPIISRKIDREKIMQMVTATMKLKKKKKLAPWNRSYDKTRQYIKKQRHHFSDKGLSIQIKVFPVVMCGCESWTKKKTEHRRIDAFELWC